MTSYRDRQDAWSLACSVARDAAQRELDVLSAEYEQRRAELAAKHARIRSEIDRPFEAESQRLEQAFRVDLARTMPQVIATFLDTERAADAKQIAETWAGFSRRAYDELGSGLTDRGLTRYFCDHEVASNPRAADSFGNPAAWLCGTLGGIAIGIPNAEQLVTRAIESGNAYDLKAAFIALAAELARIGAVGVSSDSYTARRWFAERSGNDVDAIDEAAAAAKTAELAARRARIEAARAGENVPGAPATWLEAVRQGDSRLADS